MGGLLQTLCSGKKNLLITSSCRFRCGKREAMQEMTHPRGNIYRILLMVDVTTGLDRKPTHTLSSFFRSFLQTSNLPVARGYEPCRRTDRTLRAAQEPLRAILGVLSS